MEMSLGLLEILSNKIYISIKKKKKEEADTN